jgi:RHS repeat-associated protein
VYCFDGKKPMRLSGPDRVECAGSVAGNERGHLTGAGNLLSRTEYEHDLAGRVTRVIQKTEGSPATNGERAVEYQYWASDRVKETKLTSGRRVAECIDARLRVVWASGVRPWGDCGAGTEPAFGDAYVRGAEYAPFGALARWQLGNGLWEVSEFNARMQMVRKRMGNTANAQGCAVSGDDALCLEWGYGPEGSNNGNLIEARQWAPKTAGGYLQLQSGYSYDGRNRLLAFQENVVGGGSGGGSWGQTSAYDRYGNRWAVSWGVAQSQGTPNQQGYIDVATNRVVTALVGTGTQAVSYDAAGHMIGHPHVAGALSYDAEGRRVKRIAGGVTSWYWYGADGGMVAEDTNDAVSNGVEYLSVDALGSTRLVTRGDKSVAARMDYWPFGEEVLGASSQGNRDLVGGYTGAAAVKQRFTGKERDVETGLDYFGARYMAAAQGRFTSPDAPFADQDPADPQSWNLYAYARNNPLLFVDPTGQYTCHSSVSAQECTNFQDSLTEAQKSADALKQKYGANSTQYTDAQRAIDSYGAAGVDNGVVIKVGNTGSAGAQVQVGGVAGPKTKDNPTGQQIDVTFGTGQLGKGGAANAGLSAHEGSHVADGSAWVASGFKDALNPTRYATESRAYRIQANIYEGQGYLYGTFSPTELMWFRGWPQSNVDARIDYWLRIPKAQGGLYGVIPSDKTKAFTPGARLRR